VYSLNAPVPSAVAALATDLASDLVGAQARTRGGHTLVVKRLGDEDAGYAHLEARARDALGGTPACEARVAAVEVFETVPSGTAPVVYLRVESPGLVALHDRLCDRFDLVDGIEGENYVPHVTVARGGSIEAARSLAERDVEPVEWVVDDLVFWDARRDQPATHVSLPA
jgi:2'-5' RNA ligase